MAGGLLTTLLMAGAASIASGALGIVVGIALAYSRPAFQRLLRIYVEIWRGLPLIVVLFFAFFALPAVGIVLKPFFAAVLGLTLWGSSVMGENVRGAIQAVPHQQIEAGRSLGLHSIQIIFLVVLPQAMRRLLAPTMNLLTSLIHATSLSAMLGSLELLESAQRTIQRLLLDSGNSHSFAILAAVMICYFIICYPLILVSRRLERRFAF
jgi:polar amino acid transport system permease protein